MNVKPQTVDWHVVSLAFWQVTKDVTSLKDGLHCVHNNQLDSMLWFSHRHSPSPPGGHAMVSSVAACYVRPSYGARPTMHCQWGWLGSFLFFFVPGDLDLWRSNSGEIFCTMYLTAKFDRPMFSRSEVIVQTNKQTPLKTSTSLFHTTPAVKHSEQMTTETIQHLTRKQWTTIAPVTRWSWY